MHILVHMYNTCTHLLPCCPLDKAKHRDNRFNYRNNSFKFQLKVHCSFLYPMEGLYSSMRRSTKLGRKFTQSKPFSGFTKEITGQIQKFTQIWKKLHEHGWQVCMFFNVCVRLNFVFVLKDLIQLIKKKTISGIYYLFQTS